MLHEKERKREREREKEREKQSKFQIIQSKEKKRFDFQRLIKVVRMQEIKNSN